MKALETRLPGLACALALTLGAGIAAPLRGDATTPWATRAATLARSGIAAATAPIGMPVREQRSDHGPRTGAARFRPLDAQGRARYVVILDGEPVASLAGLPAMTGKARRDMHSAPAQARASALRAQQHDAASALAVSLGRTVTPLAQFQHALNAMVVEMTPAEAARAALTPGVARVNRESVRELATYNTHVLVGADAVWNGSATPGNLPSKGEGMVIGDIDSGINWKSASFAATGSDGVTVTNPLGSGTYLGNCLASGTVKNGYTSRGFDVGHCNNKLIGIYNTEYGGAPSATGYNAASGQDLDGHGSHTASTAAGNDVNPASYAGATFHLSGVAPHANVIAYLACGTADYSCYDTGIAAAFDQAVADGIVDVLNDSIAGPEDSPWSSTIELAALNAEAAGIFIVQAAGNDGPAAGSLRGNAAPWTTTVAATSPAKIPSFAFGLVAVAGSSAVPAATRNLAAIPGSAPTPAQAYANLPLIQSPGFADGSSDGCSAFAANTFKRGSAGAIAVLHLDQTTSHCGSASRRSAALAAGAVVVVFVDTQFISLRASGSSYSVLASDWSLILATPGIDVSTNGNATATLGFPSTVNNRRADLIATYSARGPVALDLLKPDLSAPGDNVLAALSPTSTSGYTASSPDPAKLVGLESGTSMAAPHVAGAAALVRAIHPAWTPMQVKSALMSTAATVYSSDGSAIADANTAGAGRIDLSQATRAGLLFDETKARFLAANPASGGAPAALNLASYAAFDCVDTCVFPRTVSSALATSGTWTIAVSGLPTASTSLDKTTLSLAAGASASFTLSVDAKALAAGQAYTGMLTLTPSDNTLPTQHLPIAIRAASAKLRADVSAVARHAAVGQKVTQVVNVSNAGNPNLQWSVPSTTLRAQLVNRALNASNGMPDRTIVTAANATQVTSTSTNDVYAADFIDIYGSGTTLAEVAVHGFAYNTATQAYPPVSTIATQLALRVWSDAASAPNGRPGNTVTGDANPLFQFPAAAGGLGPTHAGVRFPGVPAADDIIDIDLVAAGASPPALAAGRYWLNLTPSIVSDGGAAGNISATNTWYWALSDSTPPYKTPPAVVSIANSTTTPNRAWQAINTATFQNAPGDTGLAMQVWANAACGAAWLKVDRSSGTLGLGASAALNLTLDATGLAAGTYNAYLCLSGNGTSPANALTTDQDALLVPVTLTVVAAPAKPTCTATPNPVAVSANVSIACSGAAANSSNSIPGATCSPNPTTNGSFTCTGTGAAIGSNPTLTTATAAGDAATSTVTLTVQGSVTVSASAGANGSVTPGSASVAVGANTSFTFSALPHYHVDTTSDTCGGSATFTAGTGAYAISGVKRTCTVSATFALDTFTLAYSAGAQGSIAGSATQTVAYGGNGAAVVAVPAANSHFVQWSDGVTTATRRDTAIGANLSVSASFAANSYAVNAVADAGSATHGSITPANQPVAAGGIATFTVQAHTGYNATLSGDTCSVLQSAGSATWHSVAITQPCQVVAAFVPDYVPLNPMRLLDTRAGATTVDGVAAGGGALAPGETRLLPVIARGGVPGAAVGAVALNLTAVTPTSSGYLTLWSGDGAVPGAGNLNFSIGRTLSALAIAQLNEAGGVGLYNGGTAAVNVTASVLGYFPSSSTFQPVTPQRFMDTRAGATTIDGVNASAPAAATQIDLPVTGRGPLPTSGVGAVLLSVTGFAPTSPGYVAVWPTGQPLPAAGNLNLNTGVTLSNPTFAKIGSGGDVSFYNGSGNTVNLIANLQGWFPLQSGYTPIVPQRFLDTRPAGSTIDGASLGAGPLQPNQTLTVHIAGRGNVPATGVTAVAVNLVAVNSTSGGYLTLWPASETQPTVGSINLNNGLTLPNLVICKLDADGSVKVFSGALGPTDVVINVQGWFAGDN